VLQWKHGITLTWRTLVVVYQYIVLQWKHGITLTWRKLVVVYRYIVLQWKHGIMFIEEACSSISVHCDQLRRSGMQCYKTRNSSEASRFKTNGWFEGVTYPGSSESISCVMFEEERMIMRHHSSRCYRRHITFQDSESSELSRLKINIVDQMHHIHVSIPNSWAAHSATHRLQSTDTSTIYCCYCSAAIYNIYVTAALPPHKYSH